MTTFARQQLLTECFQTLIVINSAHNYTEKQWPFPLHIILLKHSKTLSNVRDNPVFVLCWKCVKELTSLTTGIATTQNQFSSFQYENFSTLISAAKATQKSGRHNAKSFSSRLDGRLKCLRLLDIFTVCKHKQLYGLYFSMLSKWCHFDRVSEWVVY